MEPKNKKDLERLAAEYGIEEPGIVEDESGVAFYDHLTAMQIAYKLGLIRINVGDPEPWGNGGYRIKVKAVGYKDKDARLVEVEAWGRADRDSVSSETLQKGIIMDMAEKRARSKAIYLLYPEIFNPPLATPAQKRKIHALGKELGLDHEALKAEFGISTFTRLNSWRAEEIINELEWRLEMQGQRI